MEAGYHDFGDFEQRFTINGVSNSASLSADGFTLGMKATRPLSTKISVYGRAGMFFWDGDAEVNNVSQATPEDTNPYFGAGLGYAMSDQLQLIGDWTRYKLEGSSSNVFSVGFQFRF